MSYAIANVIYGIDLSEFPWNETNLNPEDYDFEDADSLGLESAYSASDLTPMWLGPEIWKFNECENFTLAEMNKKCEVTPKHIQQWKTALNRVIPEVLEAIKDFIVRNPDSGYSLEPRVCIIWSSS